MVTKTSWSQRFTVKNPKASKPALFDIDPSIFQLFDDFGRMLANSPKSDGERDTLHTKFLDVLSVESKAIWDKQIAEAQLKKLCGESDGVDGICGWPRISKAKEELDLLSFMQNHENIYSTYLLSKVSTSAVIIKPKRGY